MLDENTQSEQPSIISEEEFQAAASPSNLNGRINLRVEIMLQKELEDIAEDSGYPLHSISQVVRYCCLVGLERLRQWKPQPTLLGAIKAASALAARDKIQCESLDLIQRVSERVAWYIEKKYYEEAITFIAQIRSYFESVQEDFWAAHIRQEIDAKVNCWFEEIENAKTRDR